MFSIKLNIGNLSTPVIGSGWIAVDCDFSEALIIKSREKELIVRLKLDGSLKFVNETAKALHTLYVADENEPVGIKVYLESIEKYEGWLSLKGTYDLLANTCELEAEKTEDDYTIIIDSKETDVNMLQGTKLTSQFTMTSIPFEVFRHDATGPHIPDNFVLNIAPDWDSGKEYGISQEIDLYSGATEYIYNTVVVKVSGVNYKSISTNNLNNPPASSPGEWEVLSATNLRVYTQQQNRAKLTSFVYSEIFNTWVYGYATPIVETIEFTRCRYLKEFVENMLEAIDINITFDENTYCTYFNDKSYLNEILVADKSDVKRYTSSNPATREYMTFEELEKMLKAVFNLDWRLNGRAFELKHPTEISLVLPPVTAEFEAHYLTTYKNINWSDGKQKFNVKGGKEVGKEYWKVEDVQGSVFGGMPITYPIGTKESKYDLKKLNCDVETIISGKEEIKDDGYVLLTTEIIATEYIIIEYDGYVNGRLKVSNIITDHQITGDRPHAKGKVNGVDDVVLVKKPNKEFEIMAPIRDPEQINFDYLVQTDLGNAKVNELSIPLNGNHSTLKLVL